MTAALVRHWPSLVLAAAAVLGLLWARSFYFRKVNRRPPRERLSEKWRGWPDAP